MGFEEFPVIVGWELTLACNIRCRHCASSAGLPRDKELTLPEALRLCDQFPDLAVQEVDFTGGEPLLRPEWWRIAEHLTAKGITIRMVTNGLGLGPEVVARMRDVGLATVGISVDGLEATHDLIRGQVGLFRRVMSGIERARAAGIRVGVITAVNALNLDDLPALMPLLEARGVNHWQLQPNLPQGRSHEAADLWLSDPQFLQLGAFFRHAYESTHDNGFKVVPADSLGYFTELDIMDPPWRGCPAGVASVGITSDGRVKGCLSMPDDLIEGNLRERDLWDIWFDPAAFAYSRHFSLEELGPVCRGCDHAEQCQGGCSSMSYGCTGRFHNDPYCLHGIRRRNPSVAIPTSQSSSIF